MQLQLVEHNLVLLPGLDGTGLLFNRFLSVLPPEFNASVVSYPNHQPLTYKQLLSCIRAKMPWDKPVTLVAESFGGPLALEFAAAQPENVRAVVLVCTFVDNPLPFWIRWAEGILQDSWFKRKPPEALLRKLLVDQDSPPWLVESLQAAISSVAPEVLAFRVRQVLAVDARVALHNCQKPILYLMGQRDKLVGKHCWEKMVMLKPNMTTVALDSPHLLLQCKPREAFAAIEKFLTGASNLRPAAEPGKTLSAVL